MNLFWYVPMQIVSPYATVAINEPWADDTTGKTYLFRTTIDNYAIVPGKGSGASGGFRPVIDSLSQTDGMSIQPPYIDGFQVSMELQFFVCPDGTEKSAIFAGTLNPDTRADLQAMDELIMGVLNSLRTFPTDVSTQQYLWLPPGHATYRLLDGVMLGSWPTPDFTKGPPEVRLRFDLVCPYPYGLTDAPRTTGPIAPGGTAFVPNLGNTSQLPILMIPGLAHFVQVTVLPSGLSLIYDSTLPGALPIPAGHTLQIDFHEGSCLLDGDPDLDFIAGLDPSATSFFALLPEALSGGANEIEVSALSDGDVTVVSYDAWV